jgi:hypothetical protein
LRIKNAGTRPAKRQEEGARETLESKKPCRAFTGQGFLLEFGLKA